MQVDALFAALGRGCVRFRWLVVLIWVAAAVAAVTQLPSLSSVTQGSNTKFLPASAPSERAAQLAAPFGTANLLPVPVVAAVSHGQLTAGDVAALTSLQARLGRVASVRRVLDVGRSGDGQAEQLLVLASQAASGNPNYAENLVDGLRAQIARAGLPPGLQVHLAGDTAISVDQQKATGNTGSRVQDLSLLFIIVLLVLIFRSLSLALTTVAPALMAVLVSGPLVGEAALHGLEVSPLAQYLMIVLVLGAGTDYGLFLVFRVREELRAGGHDPRGECFPGTAGLARSVLADAARPRPAAAAALVRAVTRVGESVTFSAATVIAAVLTLLVASFPFYSNLGVPFAIAIGVTLLAGLTLLPALLSIRLSLVAIKRSAFQAALGRPKLAPWDIQVRAATGWWGRAASAVVRRPVPTLIAGVLVFGALALGVLGYVAGGFGGDTTPPPGSDSAAGTALLARHFPQSAANPTSLIFRFRQPVWTDPSVLSRATSELLASGLFRQVAGPLNPAGARLAPAEYAALHAQLGPAGRLPQEPPGGTTIPPALYQLYRATANYVSAGGRTVQYSTGLRAGDPGSTAALNAVPALRAETTRVAHSVGAADSGVGGEAPALYDISALSNSDLVRVIPIAIVAIGVLLALVLRSLVAPLYLIASVGLSYLAALGLSVLIFIEIAGHHGLVFFLPFLMFIFLLALGEDYNILVMTRIREEARSRPLPEAVSRAIGVTGTTVTSAGLVLVGTFAVFAVVAGRGANGSEFRDIALGLAFGILMDTFGVRTLLVPAMVVLLGRWNWWPSGLGAGQAARTPVGDETAPAAEPTARGVPGHRGLGCPQGAQCPPEPIPPSEPTVATQPDPS